MVLSVQIGDLGLVLDLVGAILLFVYGLAPLLSKDGSMSLLAGTSDYLKRKAKKYETLSRMGIGLIFVGFTLQLLGNHISWSQDIDLIVILITALSLLAVIVFLRVIRRHWKHKYEIKAHYIPQFDKTKPSHSGDHLWLFVVTNNSKHPLAANLHTKADPRIVTILRSGESSVSIKPTRNIQLKDIKPFQSLKVLVYGLGGHPTDGLDCYLQINKKIVRPSVSHFDDEE